MTPVPQPAATPVEPSWPPADPSVVLACTLWMEARNQGSRGLQAVANVIVNRANHPSWWGSDIRGVCLASEQFSSWNEGSTQVPLVKQAIASGDSVYNTAVETAKLAVAGTLPDITMTSDSYYALSMHTPPKWATPERFTVQIGTQRFYRVQI